MGTYSVVEHFNIFKYYIFGLLLIIKLIMIGQFCDDEKRNFTRHRLDVMDRMRNQTTQEQENGWAQNLFVNVSSSIDKIEKNAGAIVSFLNRRLGKSNSETTSIPVDNTVEIDDDVPSNNVKEKPGAVSFLNRRFGKAKSGATIIPVNYQVKDTTQEVNPVDFEEQAAEDRRQFDQVDSIVSDNPGNNVENPKIVAKPNVSNKSSVTFDL